MNINQRIQELICNSNVSQKALSSAISVPTSTLNNWIKLGRSIPSEYIIPICEFFDISIDYLLTGKEKSSQEEHLSENELEMLEIFQKFNDREQIKLIGKLEELYRQKQIKEDQKPAAFKVARSADGQFRKTELSAEELKRIHNLPEDTDF